MHRWFCGIIIALYGGVALGQEFEPMPPHINTPDFVEFAPTVSPDGKTVIYETFNGATWKLYETQFRENGLWSQTHYMPINETDNEEDFFGGAFISYDGKMLIFTSEKEGGAGDQDIWIAEKAEGGWGTPYNLGTPINTAAYEGFPSLSPDGRNLFFMRKLDDCYALYMSTKEDGAWKEPKMIEFPVHTACEKFPRIMPDGKTLVFSSNRLGGMGGYDLYATKMFSDSSWAQPQNLDFLNTTADDEVIAVPASARLAFLSNTSNGLDDLFKTNLPGHWQPGMKLPIKGIVHDARSNKPLKATVVLNNAKSGEKIAEIETKENGTFFFEVSPSAVYEIAASKSGYKNSGSIVDLSKFAGYEATTRDISMESIETHINTHIPDFQAKNIQFSTASAELAPSSVMELEQIIHYLAANPGLKIHIHAHTDDVGSVPYNQELSEKRAHSAVSFLISRGIDKNRIQFKGYGELTPLLPNTSDENKAQNRRVEFEIINVEGRP